MSDMQTIQHKFILILLVGWTCFILGAQAAEPRFVLSDWNYEVIGQGKQKPTKVPTTLTRNLIEEGVINQPYYRDNFLKFYDYETKDVTYWTSIPISYIQQCKNKRVKKLVFEGLDTHCDVSLNGEKLFESHNMYRQYEYNAPNFVEGGINKITVRCNSSANFDIAQQKQFKEEFGFQLPQNFSFTRKPAYQYGWDWGPRILTVGIWKQVRLQCFDSLNIKRIALEYSPVSYQNLSIDKIVAIADLTDLNVGTIYSVDVEIRKGNKEIYLKNQKFRALEKTTRFKSQPFSFDAKTAGELIWWTWDIGQPNLFNLTIKVNSEEATIQTGFRTVKVIQEKDTSGNGTSFIVNLNGYNLFMRGGNYIPPAMQMSNIQQLKVKYKEVRKQSLFARFNMIRVWGGGHYEHDAFYQEMDEAGILIWHDLMFACAMYPIFGDYSTVENIKGQMSDNIGRIGTHPSIALWNGNNEVWIGWQQWGWKKGLNETQLSWAEGMYHEIFSKAIPEIISDLTPDIFYWETSPSSSANDPASIISGDIHFWRVWGAGTPIEQYQTYIGRFNSEYGMQSMPEYSSIIKYTNQADRNINSYVLRLHERHPKGDEYLPMYTESACQKTNDLKRYSYFSQIMQAYAFQMGIRSLRGNKPYCMGSLYWQLNDVWPVSSWASVDYYGNYKASHYRIRKSYSLFYSSIYHNPQNDNYIIFVTNQYLDKKNFYCQLYFIDVDGTLRKHVTFQKSVEGLGITTVVKYTKKELEDQFQLTRTFVLVQVRAASGQVSENNYFFASPKNQYLLLPGLSYSFANNSIKLFTKYLATYVWIRSKTNKPLTLSENYFDMIPGLSINIDLPQGIDTDDIEVTCYQIEALRSSLQAQKTSIQQK